MNRRNLVSMLLAAAVLALLSLPGTASAEIFMRQATHTDAFQMGAQQQPAKDDTSSIWIGKDRMSLLQSDGNAVIVDAKTQMLYLINNADSSYAVHDIKEIAKLTQSLMDTAGLSKDTSAEAQQKKAALAMISAIKVNVTPTTETQKIKKWNATKYVVEIGLQMMTTKADLWTTTDINVDYDMLQLLNNAFKVEMPGFGVVMEQMKKVKGVVVSSKAEVSFMGMNLKATSDLVDLVEKPAPAGTFEVPAGYKKVDKINQGGM
jgi:hypothetical protein